jgi:hypothetical protein
MKNILINKIKSGLFLALLPLLGSCEYLDVIPDNVATIDYAFSNRASVERYVYTCYSYRPKIGDVLADPAMGGADETWQNTPQLEGRILPPSRIAWGEQNATNPYFNFWESSLFIAIHDCNVFLENIGKVEMDMTDRDKIRFTAEVQFLKAYYHFYLLRAYGPVPIVDVNIPVSADVEAVKVWREPVDDVVEYIVNLLKEAITGLPNAIEVITGTEAGRVDKLVAYTLIAEVRLWAASPLVNGNSIYADVVDGRGKHLFPQGAEDPDKWVLAAKACEDAINICHEQGKSLYRLVDPLTLAQDPVFQLQTTYRNVICDRWNSELIWGCTSNDNARLSKAVVPRIVTNSAQFDAIHGEWAPTMKTVEWYYSSNGVPIDEDKEWMQSNTWYDDRYKIRPEASTGDEIYLVQSGTKTPYLHYNREPRFYASIGFDKGVYFGDGYYVFPTNVKSLNLQNGAWGGFQGSSAGGYSITGYVAKKLDNIRNNQATNAYSFEYYPFPVYRLADLYLMYAEAVNEVEGPNGANSATLFAYLDDIRDRAGLAGVKESWTNFSTNPTKPDTKEGLREIIRRERSIELAFEGKRFWDIRRWKKITDLNEQPRGWNIMGENNDDFYKVVNVHPRSVSFSTKDYFFPIKESNLYVNDRLIQNYGW